MKKINIPIKVEQKFDLSKDTVSDDYIDLIIKPTVACNFKCTFCSSTYLSDNPKDKLSLDNIARFLDHFPKTQTIIVNGGDPLMMSPDYYYSILKMLDDRKMTDTILSFTSNLWLFYKHPEKWGPLFQNNNVGVCTSFQYGTGRLKHDLTPFTEDEFWKVSDLFLKWAGYRPSFISVINKEEECYVVKTAELARDMGVACKINYLLASGKETKYKDITMGSENKMYTLADMYRMYIELYDKGLWMWEYNTMQFIERLNNKHTTCPLKRDCGKSIRAMHPDGSYYSCGAFGDDLDYSLDFHTEMRNNVTIDPLDALELQSMHDGCYTCPMFQICNGCKKTIKDTKKLGLVDYHCKTMKSIADRILEIANNESHLNFDKNYSNCSEDNNETNDPRYLKLLSHCNL